MRIDMAFTTFQVFFRFSFWLQFIWRDIFASLLLLKFELIVLTNYSYVVKNSQEFDAFDFDEIFYQQKANFPCFFIKANLSRTRNLLIVTYFSNYISNRLVFLLYENNQNSNSNSRTRSVFWVAKFILNITQPFHKTVKTWEKSIKKSIFKDGKFN